MNYNVFEHILTQILLKVLVFNVLYNHISHVRILFLLEKQIVSSAETKISRDNRMLK